MLQCRRHLHVCHDGSAYALEIHRFRATLGGADEAGPVFLRATTIFRREDDAGGSSIAMPTRSPASGRAESVVHVYGLVHELLGLTSSPLRRPS
jgi:hypothetical protein